MARGYLLLLLSLGLVICLCCFYISRPPVTVAHPLSASGADTVESPLVADNSSQAFPGLNSAPSAAGVGFSAMGGRRGGTDENRQAPRASIGLAGQVAGQESGGTTVVPKRAHNPNAEQTQILAVIDGDGSGFALSESQLGAFGAQSVTESEIALRNPLVNEQAKVNALAQLTDAYADKAKEVHFLQEIARDLKQPDSVRVGAFLKLADFGAAQVATFEQTEDNVLRLEVDLWKRLKEFERQEGLPPGALRASSQ
jgi:hypothetical protein